MPNKNKSARERAMELMLRNANNGTKNTIRRDGSTKPGSTVSSNQTNTTTTSQSTSTSQSTNSSATAQKSSQTAHTTSQGGSQGTSYSDKFYHAAGRKYTSNTKGNDRRRTSSANARNTTAPRHRVDDEVKSDRATLVVGGAGKQWLGGQIAGLGTGVQSDLITLNSYRDAALNSAIKEEEERRQNPGKRPSSTDKSSFERYDPNERFSTKTKDGVDLNDVDRSKYYDISAKDSDSETYKKIISGARDMISTGDELISSGGQDIEQAKEGLGTIGKVGVDLVANGVQMLGDRALAFVPVVGQALAMGSLMNRAGGTASYEARQLGMNPDQQYQYALGTSVIEGLSEAMFNSVSAFKSTYGKGALSIADNLSFKTAAKNIVQNVLKSDTGRAVAYNLARLGGGALEEGTEELVAGITEPALKYMIMKSTDPNATYDVNLKDLGYDFMIGALMGGIPGSVDMIRGVRADVNLANSEAYKAFEDGNAFAQQYMDRAMVQGRVKDNGRILKTDAEVLAEKMQKQIDNGGQILPGQTRRLMEALNESYTTNETSFRNKRARNYQEAAKKGETNNVVSSGSRAENEEFSGVSYEKELEYEDQARDLMGDNAKEESVEAVGRVLASTADSTDVDTVLLDPDAKAALEILAPELQDSNLPVKHAEAREVIENVISSREIATRDSRLQEAQDRYAKNIEASLGNMREGAKELLSSNYQNAVSAMGDGSGGIYKELFNRIYIDGTTKGADFEKTYDNIIANNDKAIQEAFPKEFAKKIFDQGRMANVATVAKETAQAKAAKYAEQNKIEAHIEEAAKKYVDQQTFEDIDKFAKRSKVRVEIVEHIVAKDDNGNILYDENGKELRANGKYENGIIYIAADSDNKFITIAKHELTHHIKEISPERYQELEDFVFQRWYNSDFQAMQDAIVKYQKLYQNITPQQAKEEIIADASEAFFTDEGAIQDVCSFSGKLAKALSDGIHSLLDTFLTIQNADKKTRGLGGQFLKQMNILKDAERMWAEALDESVNTDRAAKNGANADLDTEAKHSLGYHAGDLGKSTGDDYWGIKGRSTGHFGFGTYFVGDKMQISDDYYGKRPLESVDFDKYNLFKPRNYEDGERLHDALKKVNDYIKGYNDFSKYFNIDYGTAEADEWYQKAHGINKDLDDFLWDLSSGETPNADVKARIDKFISEMPESNRNKIDSKAQERYEKDDSISLSDWRYYEAQSVVENYTKEWNEKRHKLQNLAWDLAYGLNFRFSQEEIENALKATDRVISKYDSYKRGLDSASTVFMKQLGYEGVDVRGIKGLDNTSYGSVIYDLKGEDLARKKEIGTAKYSISYSQDSDGNTLSKGQQKYFANSKMVDGKGNLKVMYHGSPNKFTVFDIKKAKPGLYGRGFYFTDSKSRASQYGEPYGVYLNVEAPLQAGSHDITRDQLRNYIELLANDEDYGLENYGYGATVDSVLKSVWGKDDFAMLQDINASAVGDFVEAVKLFNKVNGTSYDGIIAPTETIVFKPEQVKEIDNKNPTKDPDMRFSLTAPVEETQRMIALHNIHSSAVDGMIELGGLAMPSFAVMPAGKMQSGYGEISIVARKESIDPQANSSQKIFGGDAWTPMFPTVNIKIDSKVADRIDKKIKDLLGISITHSDLPKGLRYPAIDTMNLADQLQKWGDPYSAYGKETVMKMAFIKDGLHREPVIQMREGTLDGYDQDFWELVDDRMPKKPVSDIHSEDVMKYEPVLRGVIYDLYEKPFEEKIKNAGKTFLRNPYSKELSFSEVDSLIYHLGSYRRNGIPQVVDTQKTVEDLDNIINGHEEEYKKWMNDLFKGVIEKRGIRNNVDIYTPSGNRRSFEALHYEYNLANIVKAMKSQSAQGNTSIFTTAGNVKGAALKDYKDIESVRAELGRIVSERDEKVVAKYDEFNDRTRELANKVADDPFTGSEILADVLSHSKTKDGIYRFLNKEYKFLETQDHVDLRKLSEEIYDLGQLANTLPMEYFESKLYRAFPLEEAAAIVVPDDLSAEQIEKLKEFNDNVLTYESGNEEDRLAKVNQATEQPGARFSISEGMTDEERYEELKNQKIRIVPYNKGHMPSDSVSINALQSGMRKKAHTVLIPLAKELGIIRKGYTTPDIKVIFNYSGNNLAESTQKQVKLGGKDRFYRFAQMFTCFNDVIENAKLIEVHSDKYAGQRRADTDFKKAYVLVSAFRDGNAIIPVELLIKEFGNKDNTLYVTVTLDGIEKAGQHGQSRNTESSPLPALNYSLADLLSKIKSKGDVSLSKYIPKQFASRGGKLSLSANDQTYLDAVNRGDMETAQRMVDEEAKKHGYDIKAYHGTGQKFTRFDRSKQGSNYEGYLQYGNGFYFATSEKGAKAWGNFGKQYGGDDVMSVYLKADRMLDVTQEAPDWAKHYLMEKGYNEYEATFATSNSDRFLKTLLEAMNMTNQEVQDLLISKGYDGIKELYRHGTGQLVVFYPVQIKSADPVTYDDNGDAIPLSKRFTEMTDDIRYSISESSDLIDRYIADRQKRINDGEQMSFFGSLNETLPSKPKEKTLSEQFYDDAIKTIADIRKKGGWTGKEITHLLDEVIGYQDFKFIERLNDKSDDNAQNDFTNFLTYFTDEEMLRLYKWYFSQYRIDKYWKTAFRSGKMKFNKLIDKRAEEIRAGKAGGRDLGIEKRDYTATEMRQLFNELNTDKELSALAKKVFDCIDKNFKVRYQGVSNIKGFNFTNEGTFGEAGGRTVHLNMKYFNSGAYTDQQKAHTLLHESIHSVTVYAINLYHGSDPYTLSFDIRQACEALDEVYNSIKYDKAFENEYGITNVKEMVAELSNPLFRAKLKAKNLYGRIVNAIKKMLGIKSSNDTMSAYTAANNALETILNNADAYNFEKFANRVSSQYNGKFSLSESSEAAPTTKEYKSTVKKLEEQVSDLKAEFKRTNLKTADPKQVRIQAGRFLKRHDANNSLHSEVVDTFNKIFGLYKDKGTDAFDEVYEIAQKTAVDVVNSISVIHDEGAEDYKAIKDYLKNTEIKVSDEMKRNITDYNDFRKHNFGRLKLVNGETSNIDNVYMELMEMFPGQFTEDYVNPADQLYHIVDVLDNYAPYYESLDGASEEMQDYVVEIASDIMETAYNLQTKKTFADKKYEEKVKAVKKAREEALASRNKALDRQKQRYEEKIEALKQHNKDFKAETRERAEKKRRIKQISNVYKRLLEKLQTPSDTKHLPDGYAPVVTNVLKLFDFTTPGMEKWAERNGEPSKRYKYMIELRKQLDEMSKTDTGVEVDPDLLDLVDEIMADIGENEKLVDLDSSTLEDIATLFRAFEHQMNTYNKAFDENNKKATSETAHSIFNDLDKIGDGKGKWKLGVMGRLLTSNFNPSDFFELLGGDVADLYNATRKGFDKYVDRLDNAKTFLQDRVDNKKADKWANHVATYKTSSGEEIELTDTQLMSLYCLNKREQAQGHIYGGGIVSAPLKVKNMKKLIPKELEKKRVIPSIEDVGRWFNTLTDEQKQVANDIQRYFVDEVSVWGNETSMKLYNYKKFGEPNYFPIQSSKDYMASNFDQRGEDPVLKNIGASKATVKNANNVIVVDDIFTVFSKHVAQMASYNAYVPAITDFQRVWNYTEGNDQDMVKARFERVYGRKAADYIENFFKNLNGVYKANFDPTIFDKGLGLFKKAAVGGNVRVLVQQPTAIARSALLINPAYLTAAVPLATAHPKQAYRDMIEHCPIARWKTWGFYSSDITSASRDLKNIMIGKDALTDKIFMNMYGTADNVTWTVIFKACQLQVEAQNKGLEKGSDEYWEKVNDLASRVFDRTQVVDSPFHRSELMKSQDGLVKAATAFMAEPTKTINMLNTELTKAMTELKNGHPARAVGLFTRVAMVITANAAALALAQAMVDAMRHAGGDDDKDKGDYEDRFKNYWKSNFTDNLNPFGMIPYIKDIKSLWDGYDVLRLDMNGVQKIIKSIQYVQKYYEDPAGSKYSAQEEWTNLALNVMYTVGVPISNAKRDIEGLYVSIMEGTGHPEVFFHQARRKYQLNDKTKGSFVDMYYDAVKGGNTALANEIHRYLIKGGITEKYIKQRKRTWEKHQEPTNE